MGGRNGEGRRKEGRKGGKEKTEEGRGGPGWWGEEARLPHSKFLDLPLVTAAHFSVWI